MIKIIFHEDISLYTVECDNEKVYECLSQDEVLEVVKQETLNTGGVKNE